MVCSCLVICYRTLGESPRTHDLVSSQCSLAGDSMFILFSEFLLVSFPFMGFLVDPIQFICECLLVSVLLVYGGVRPFLLCCNCNSIIPFCGPHFTLLSLPLCFVFNFSTMVHFPPIDAALRLNNIWFRLTNLVGLSLREF